MGLILPIKGVSPSFGEDNWVAPNATVVGDVQTGKHCTIWFNAVVRGDVNSIRIGDYSNIQEKTGYDCCKWLVAESMNKNIPLPQIYIHSANPIGSANMMGYINNYRHIHKLPQNCVRVQIEHTIKQ